MSLVGPLLVALAFGVLVGWALGAARRRAEAAALGARLREAERKATDSAWALEQAQHGNAGLMELLVNLPEFVNRMGAAHTTTDLARTTVRVLKDLVGAAKIALFLPSAQGPGKPLRLRIGVCAGVPAEMRDVAFAVGEGRLGHLATLAGVRTGDDTEVATMGTKTDADWLFHPDLSVAIRRGETLWAYVAMDGLKRSDAMIVRVVQMLADVYAVSAEGVATLERERLKAEVDALTGVFNRRYLDQSLKSEVERARGNGKPLSVFLFDIDNFKHYNDHNGHQAGDDCLRRVAQLVKTICRSSDIICRYGGEEFVAILCNTNREQASGCAERFRRAIEGTAFPHGESQPLGRVTISGGVATFPGDGEDPAALLKSADAALYVAKKSGRNRTLAAGDAAA